MEFALLQHQVRSRLRGAVAGPSAWPAAGARGGAPLTPAEATRLRSGSDVFGAGTSAYGVADLVTFADTTHKFEGRYLDWLLSPLPDAMDVYVDRSPITHADEIRAPVFVAQGLDDKVVPRAQAEQIVEALERNGVPHVYMPLEGEGHGFRRRDSIVRLLSVSLSFHGQIFGFEPADDVERVEIVGL